MSTIPQRMQSYPATALAKNFCVPVRGTLLHGLRKMSDFSRGHSIGRILSPSLRVFGLWRRAHAKLSRAVGKIGDMLILKLQLPWYRTNMQEIVRDTFKQLLPILAAAGIAAAFAFGQSLAHAAGFCAAPQATPEQVGFLGGTIKAVHQIFKAWISGTA